MRTQLEQLREALAPQYEVERELASGGMGTVFLARDTFLDREVAIKTVRPELASGDAAQRFLHEARILASLKHPNVVSVHQAGEADGLLYYVMDYMEGETLRQRLTRGPMSADEVIRIGVNLLDALEAAHAHRIVHRDVKPGNIFLEGDRALLGDFGIAKQIEASAALTSPGQRVGTPGYMAPEQISGEATPRTDVYAVGMVLYEALTGRKWPIVSTTASVEWSGVPPALSRVLLRALEWSPEDRWADAAAFRRALAPPLLHEIHRRSLWQVLAIYLLGAGLGYGLIRGLTVALGLPDWFPALAVVLLIVGLPILLVTAFVQEGFPARPRAGPTTGRGAGVGRLFSWRNAIVGGVLAFASLGVGVTGYMAMRVLGIGPIGSLVAAGVLTERERVILSDFENNTDDPQLGRAVTEAFRVDLAQSPLVTVVERAYVNQVLRRMERAGNEKLDLELAREVAIREGIKALIAGEINAPGAGFVLSARLISAEGGDLLAAYRATADDSTDIIAAIDRLSRKLRERIGESLRTIRRNEPLDEVTTASLEALRKYSQAIYAIETEGDPPRGIALLEEAIALDKAFAMAYRKLGITLRNRGTDRSRWLAALTKAYEHRDRLTDRERYLTLGTYYEGVTGEAEKAIIAYRTLLDAYPTDGWALTNLGNLYLQFRDYAPAEELFRRKIEFEPLSVLGYPNLASIQILLGKFEEAQETIEQLAAQLPGHFYVRVTSINLANARGDYDAAEAHVRALGEARRASRFWQAVTSSWLGTYTALRGRLSEADGHWRDAMTGVEDLGDPANYVFEAIQRGLSDVWFRGDSVGGLRKVSAALNQYPLATIEPLDRPYLFLALFYALTERVELAKATLAEYEAEIDPELRRGDEPVRHALLGAIALAEGRLDDAVAEARLSDTGRCRTCALPLLGRAYDLAGEADSALAIYERYVTTPSNYQVLRPGPPLHNDPYSLPVIYERLAALHEARGDTEKAVHYYGRLVVLWEDADPELQPRVEAARRAIRNLSPDR